MLNMPATTTIWTGLAPETPRERNTRSGISGLRALAWRSTNAARSATATAPRPSVSAEAKPYSLAFTIVETPA